MGSGEKTDVQKMKEAVNEGLLSFRTLDNNADVKTAIETLLCRLPAAGLEGQKSMADKVVDDLQKMKSRCFEHLPKNASDWNKGHVGLFKVTGAVVITLVAALQLQVQLKSPEHTQTDVRM